MPEAAAGVWDNTDDRLADMEMTLVRVKLVTSVEDTVGELVKRPERLGDCDTVLDTEAERLAEGELLGEGLPDGDVDSVGLLDTVAAADALTVGVPKKLVEGETLLVTVVVEEMLDVKRAVAEEPPVAEGGARVGDTVSVRTLEGDTELLLLRVPLVEPLSEAVLEALLLAAVDCVVVADGVTAADALRLAVPDTGTVNGAEGLMEEERQPELVTEGVLEVEAQGDVEAGGDPENDAEEQGLLVCAALAVSRAVREGEPVTAVDAVRAPDEVGQPVFVTDVVGEELDFRESEAAAEGEVVGVHAAEGLDDKLTRGVTLPDPDAVKSVLALGLPVEEREEVGEGVTAAEPVPADGEADSEARALSETTVAVCDKEPVRDTVIDAERQSDTEGVRTGDDDALSVTDAVKVTVEQLDNEEEPDRELRAEDVYVTLPLPDTVPQCDGADVTDAAGDVEPANPDDAETQPLGVTDVEGDCESRPVKVGAPDCEELPEALQTTEVEAEPVLNAVALRLMVPDMVSLAWDESVTERVPEADTDHLCVLDSVLVPGALFDAL